ncbi:MAG: glycosyl transferase, partial [Gammaproteobacteria bacterium]|nr:glycosyl transferase [Gammaproteobacteria bacterium]
MKNSAVTNNFLRWLIALAVVIGSLGLFSPVLNSNDAYFYAVISKTMVTSHNWVDLYYAGQDWLDKP